MEEWAIFFRSLAVCWGWKLKFFSRLPEVQHFQLALGMLIKFYTINIRFLGRNNVVFAV